MPATAAKKRSKAKKPATPRVRSSRALDKESTFEKRVRDVLVRMREEKCELRHSLRLDVAWLELLENATVSVLVFRRLLQSRAIRLVSMTEDGLATYKAA